MASETAEYRDTILTPETAFPMKADLGRREPVFLARWAEADVYRAALRAREGRSRYVFHDGPPYANGDIHYGHILNKTLKDFVVKWQLLAGRHCAFRPGWDCHGLPIELNVERSLGPKRSALSPLELRAACRVEAERWIDRQREQFKRLGVFGDWDDPYLTMSPDYEAAIVRALAEFVRQGVVYKGKKPVYWSWGARSALAEAEVEYQDRDDPSVYVRFPIASDASRARIASLFDLAATGSRPVSALVWTTTPWTLPANLAIAVHPELDYTLVEPSGRDELWLVASALVEQVLRACRTEGRTLERTIRGSALADVVARHPFIERDSPLLVAEHVTADAGTGLVHTAPGHGQDDYVLGQRHGLPPYAPVGDDGRFTDEVPQWKGINVFEANPLIVAFLHESGALASPPDLSVHHSYPHCWRTKKPVVFRATPQWFVALDRPFASGPLAGKTMRECALAEIDAIAEGRYLRADERSLLGSGWIPAWGKERIRGMIEARPDWCISRQRSWGVPIPSFRCAACGASTMTTESVEHVAAVFEREGADAWFAREPADLAPEGFRCAECSSTELTKESDIIDVWFESGSSFLGCGLERTAGLPPADLYLEGSDQHRGWFHSSLLVGVTAAGSAPYRRVLTHGFVGDENGRPYSKSEINRRRAAGEKVDYIDPEKLVADQGAELLRLWAAYEDYRGDLRYSRDHLTQVGDAYRKIRNTLRFGLGNLRGYDPANPPALAELVPIDRWALSRLGAYVSRIWKSYESYDFRDVYHATIDICTNDWSAFYFDVLKDRLYCAGPASPERRSAQHAVYTITRTTTLAMAPLLCFTAEDVWEHLPRSPGDGASVFLSMCPMPSDMQQDEQVAANGVQLLWLRDAVNAAIEPKVKAKELAHRREAAVHIELSHAQIESLGSLATDLAEAFAVADVVVRARDDAEAAPRFTVERSAHPRCPRCWRHRAPAESAGGPCDRCARVLSERSPLT